MYSLHFFYIFFSTIQGLDRGRRLNQTLANTGTAVVKTKEAVGKFPFFFFLITSTALFQPKQKHTVTDAPIHCPQYYAAILGFSIRA